MSHHPEYRPRGMYFEDFEIGQNLIGQIINGHLFEEHTGFIRMPIQPPRFLS